MLIECPFCHARAQIADDKEGAKVRCGECGRVYGAREKGRASSSSQTNPTPFIIGGVVLVVGAILFAVMSNHKPKPVVKVPEKEAVVEEVYLRGWDALSVKGAAEFHFSAILAKLTPLQTRLDGAAIWALKKTDEDPSWDSLEGFERTEKLEAWVATMVDKENEDSIANWKPFDGRILNMDRDQVAVRLQCTPADGGSESREFDWLLIEDGDRFKAISWGRYIDPATIKRAAKNKPKGFKKVTLSDGSRVHEREPEPLAHLETTPPSLRKEIDELYGKIIDLSLTKEMSRAKNRLTEIGKPAVPRLLTGLYEMPLADFDEARKVQNIVNVLRNITGQRFGFEPMVLVGSAMGTTEERRASSIKQWFAWWYKKGSKFTEKETTDALDDIIELSDEDKAWLKRHEND